MYKFFIMYVVIGFIVGCGGAVQTTDEFNPGTNDNITPIFNYNADSGAYQNNLNPQSGKDSGVNQEDSNCPLNQEDAQPASSGLDPNQNSNDCNECNSDNNNHKPLIDGIYVMVFNPDSFNSGSCASYRDADTYKLTDNKDGTALLQIQSMNKNCLGDFEKNIFSASCDITNETTGDQSYFSDYVKLYVVIYFDYDFNSTLEVKGNLFINGGCSVYRKLFGVRQPTTNL